VLNVAGDDPVELRKMAPSRNTNYAIAAAARPIIGLRDEPFA
jgi:hypothetical protein